MHLTIGQLAGRLQLNPKTIRYYEEVGLMPKARRGESGYRMYSQEAENRLRLIKRARLLGLSLHEAKQVVDYAAHGRCLLLEPHLLELLEAKLAKLEEQMNELRLLKEELQNLCDSLKERMGADRGREPGFSCSCLEEAEQGEGRSQSALFLGPG